MQLWETEHWTKWAAVKSKPHKVAVAFDGDGTHLAIGSAGNYETVEFDRVQKNGMTVGNIIASEKNGGIYYIGFSSDARWIVTASADRTAEVWDAATKELITRVETYDQAHFSPSPAVFTADSRYLVTVGSSGANWWDLRPGNAVHEACVRLHRNLTAAEWKQYVGDVGYHKTCPTLQ